MSTYREPIAPNPEPKPPKAREPFNWKRARRVAAWVFLAFVFALLNAASIRGALFGKTREAHELGCIMLGFEVAALVGVAIAEVLGVFK